MRKRLALALIAPLTLLALSACNDDPASEPDDEETSESTESTPTEEPTEDTSATEETSAPEDEASSAPEAGSGDLTPPGTDLAIGESAVVKGDFAGEPITVEVTVTAVDEGTSDDIADIGLDENPEDFTPFYIKVDATLIDGDGSSYDPAADFDGFVGDTGAGTLITFGEFEPCNGESFEPDAQPGDTISTCAPVLADKGDVVDAVAYTAGDDYSVFDGNEITWK